MTGSVKANRRRKAGYWGRQHDRTTANIYNRRKRHCANHPNDKLGKKVFERTENVRVPVVSDKKPVQSDRGRRTRGRRTGG